MTEPTALNRVPPQRKALSRAVPLVGVVTIALSGAAGMAQEAGALTPPSFAPPQQKNFGVKIPDLGTAEPPAGADKLFVRPLGMEVVGGFPELADETTAIAARFSGVQVSGVDLFAAARDLELAYARAGYPLVRVALPPQTVRDGTPVRLVVVDGRLERIDTSALPQQVRSHVAAMLAVLAERPRLTRAELERSLLLAGDTPGLTLKSTLIPGSKPGTAVLVVEGTHRETATVISLDNSRPSQLGRNTLGIGVELNSAAGLGEQFYFRSNFFPGLGGDNVASSKPRNRQLAAGVIAPLATDGTSLNLEATQSTAHPLSSLPFRFDSSFERLSVRLRHALQRSQQTNLSFEISFDATREVEWLSANGASARFAEDRMRVVRFAENFETALFLGGSLTAKAAGSIGLGGLGSRDAKAAAASSTPLTRDGADAEFQKAEIQLGYTRTISDAGAILDLVARAQTSFGQALVTSEQFGIAGPGAASAFAAGSLQGDAGTLLRAELAMPVHSQVWAGLRAPSSLYLHGGTGRVSLSRPSALEAASVRVSAYGLGIRLAFAVAEFDSTIGAEYSRGTRSGGRGTEERMHFQFAARF